MNGTTRRLVKTGIVVLWIVLLALLIKRDLFISSFTPEELTMLDRADREEYQSIYFKGSKIGYVINSYSAEDSGRVKIDQQALMRINVSEMVQQIEMQLSAALGTDGKLDTFSFNFDSPFYRMAAEGRVEGQDIIFTLSNGGQVSESRIRAEQPPFLPTVRRGYLLRREMAEGDKVKIPWFDPISLSTRSTVVEYKGRVNELINGRVESLHKFVENYDGARINFWLNEAGDVVKEESPAGFVFIKEPKFKALQIDEESEELLSGVAVQVKGEMPDPAVRQFLRYRLTLPEVELFDLNEGRQIFNGEILEVRLEQSAELAGDGASPCQNCEDFLSDTPYVQSNDPEIKEQAQRIISTTDNRLEQVKGLAGWVYENVEKRPVLGIPDALSTFKNRVGDCNEHASLFAALARSVGIPARIAVGVVYYKSGFYYHAWNEVWVKDRWLSLDTTTNQLPADVSHIKFLHGELDEQVRIGALIGKLEIEVLADDE